MVTAFKFAGNMSRIVYWHEESSEFSQAKMFVYIRKTWPDTTIAIKKVAIRIGNKARETPARAGGSFNAKYEKNLKGKTFFPGLGLAIIR